jgi:hypothetical protein
MGDLSADQMALAEEWLKSLRDFRKFHIRRKMLDLTKQGDSEELSASEAGEIQSQLKKLSQALKDLEKSS